MRVRLVAGSCAVTEQGMQAICLTAGLFMGMSGTAFFLAGLLPGPSAPWWKQYGLAALALASAYYLIRYALW